MAASARVCSTGRRRFVLATAAGLAATAAPSWATARRGPPPEVTSELPGAQLRGQGTLRFFGLQVYDARLWAESRIGPDPAEHPLALELEYARTLVGTKIAERSLQEMQRVGEFDAARGERWLAELKRLLPDVHRGDRITGIQRPGGATRFYLNGRWRGAVEDADFTRHFFGVWLSPRTSEPALRARLLGSAESGG